MPVFQFRMPAGIPGTVNRIQAATIEAQIVMTSNPPLVFGTPVAIDGTSHQVRPIGVGDTAANIYGLGVRPYPTTGNGTDGLGAAVPNTGGVFNVLKRGYMQVALGGATAAAKNGVVYVRVATPSGGKPLGGIEAAADSTNTVVMAGAYFMGPADAAGNVEVAFNI